MADHDYYLIHRHGIDPCFKPAYQAHHITFPAEILRAQQLLNIDGSEVSSELPSVCGDCGQRVLARVEDLILKEDYTE